MCMLYTDRLFGASDAVGRFYSTVKSSGFHCICAYEKKVFAQKNALFSAYLLFIVALNYF